MIVVAGASPLHYLIVVDAISALRSFYGGILPQVVAGELTHDSAPQTVRNWMARPPEWIRIHSNLSAEPFAKDLDAGESVALA